MKIPDKSKFWFGENPELVEKFKVIAEKLTGRKCCENVESKTIQALFFEDDGIEPYWTYIREDKCYFNRRSHTEMNPLTFFSWKALLGGELK